MSKRLYLLGLIIVLFMGPTSTAVPAQGIGELGEEDSKGSGTLRYKARGITDVEWSSVRTKEGDSETVTRVLQSQAGRNKRSLIQEEETTTKVDSETTKVTRKTSNFDSEGRNRVIEIVEEEQRVLPNGEEHIEISVSNPDSRGRLSVYRQEALVRTPHGENGATTRKSVYLRNSSGSFEEKVRVYQSENTAGDRAELEETTEAVDVNGRWAPSAKRTVTTTLKDGTAAHEEEKVYRKDSRGRLTLSEHVISTHDKDRQGNEQWTVETHSTSIAGTRRAPGGKLQLDRRVTVVSKKLPGNAEQTIEEVEKRSPANPRGGLEVVQRTITTSRLLSDGGRELQIEVQGRDGSGRLKTVMTQTKKFSN
jgi:hypothetical protein